MKKRNRAQTRSGTDTGFGVYPLCLFLAIFALSSIAEANAQEGQNPSRYRPYRAPVRKLKLAVFPQEHFKVLLPVQYEKDEQHSGSLGLFGYDLPHGIYGAMCLTAPARRTVSPNMLKPLVTGMAQVMKIELASESTPITLRGNYGIECKGTCKDSPMLAKVRGYIVGRRVYVLMVAGMEPWLRSNAVSKFFDSFDVIP